MSDSQLRKSLIRLAHQHPEFRGDLLPLLRQAAEKGYTLRWLQGGFEVKGGPWNTEQEALAAAKKVRENLNALMRSTGKSGDLELLDPNGKRVKLISIA